MSSISKGMGLSGRRIYSKTKETRDPWTMTKKEYNDLMYYQPLGSTVVSKSMRKYTPKFDGVQSFQKEHPDMFGNDWYNNHRYFVVKALSEGKTIPESVLKDYPDLLKSHKKVDNRHIWEMTKDELMYLPLFAHKFGKTYDDYYDDYKAIGWTEGWHYNKKPGYVDGTGYDGMMKSARSKGLSLEPKATTLQAVHDSRSPLSKSADESRSNADTIDPEDPRVKTWLRDPGRMDVRGIDTPRHDRKSKSKKRSRIEHGSKPTTIRSLR